MSDKPITPTRIIPAGAALPARAPRDDELPPWWEHPAPATPPPPPPPVVPPTPVSVPAPEPPADRPIHVVVALAQPYFEPGPEPTRRERLTAWLAQYGSPWHAAAALAAAVAPILPNGYSLATTWQYTVAETRDIWGPGWGYGLGGGALALIVYRITRTGGGPVRLLLLAVTGIGVLGAIDLFDPITALTGVHPR